MINFIKTKLKKYDILMFVRGVSIGKVGLFLGEDDSANVSPNIIIIRLKDKMMAPYVSMILISQFGQDQIKSVEGGSSKPTITAPFINTIQIPKPDEEVLFEVNKLFNMAIETKKNALTNKLFIENEFDKFFHHKKYIKSSSFSQNLKNQVRWDPHYHNPRFNL